MAIKHKTFNMEAIAMFVFEQVEHEQKTYETGSWRYLTKWWSPLLVFDFTVRLCCDLY